MLILRLKFLLLETLIKYPKLWTQLCFVGLDREEIKYLWLHGYITVLSLKAQFVFRSVVVSYWDQVLVEPTINFRGMWQSRDQPAISSASRERRPPQSRCSICQFPVSPSPHACRWEVWSWGLRHGRSACLDQETVWCGHSWQMLEPVETFLFFSCTRAVQQMDMS